MPMKPGRNIARTSRAVAAYRFGVNRHEDYLRTYGAAAVAQAVAMAANVVEWPGRNPGSSYSRRTAWTDVRAGCRAKMARPR